ncbi:MAG: hypothetical protein J0L79_01420 [Rickettsiales bacterium]|nr:hypothetical protein [Rickettsiales bacterium]
MAKAKIRVIKEWFKHNLIPSCFLEQSGEQFPAVLVRQGGMRDLLQLNEDRFDEVNSRENLAATNIIGSIIDHAEPT